MIYAKYGMMGEVVGYYIPTPESMMPKVGVFVRGVFYTIDDYVKLLTLQLQRTKY
jgi:hypothetical protein